MTADRLQHALETIRDCYDDALSPLPTPSAGKNANKQGSKPPLPSESLSIRTEVWEFLASWTRYTIGWWDDYGRISADAVLLAMRLLNHVGDLASDEVILDELPKLESLAKQLDRVANPPAAPPTPIVTSPADQNGTLVRDQYDPTLTRCTHTGQTGTPYDWWLRAHPELEQTVTIADIAERDGTDEAKARDRLRNAHLKPLNPGRRPALYDLAALEWHRAQQQVRKPVA